MSGLLIKELRLMCQQKLYFLIIAAMSVLFVSSWDNCMFGVSYCTMFCAYFSIATICYDEMNQGFSFLFTLPVDRRGYVAEKYLFGILVSVGGWLLSVLVTVSYICLTGVIELSVEWLCIAFLILLLSIAFLCITFPIQFKFGAEKSRFVMIIFLAGVFGCVKMMELFENQGFLQQPVFFIKAMQGMKQQPLLAAAAGALLLVVILVLSMRISVCIMEKKEF